MDSQKRYYLKRKDAPDESYNIIPFKRDEVIIGRSADATYVIPNNLISRKHAVFTRSGDTWVVKNLSLNGVFVNDELVPKEEQKEVKVGDIVQFGQPANFVYRFGMKVPKAGSSRQGSITQSAKRIKSTDKRSDLQANLNVEHATLEKQLNNMQTLEARLQGERDHLEVSLHHEKDNLQQQYQREKDDLEKQFAAGAVAQQVMLEEKEALARRLEKQVLELQTRLEQEHKALEERLRKEEEERRRISQEKEEVLRELEEKKRHLERKMQEERQHLQEQLQATESHREKLQKEVEAKEAMIRAKEEEQSKANQERQQLKDELALEKQALQEELEKVRHALQEKKEQFSELDSELKSKEVEMQDKMMSMESGVQERVMAEVEKNSAMVREEATKQLEEIKKEKIKLEEKLKQAQVQDQEQLSNLQEALETVEAQKLSLEQELACTAFASDNARKEVVESVSDVLETELQCPICNELFITAIMLGCSHTFCKYCIDQWKKNKRECPNCRAPISSETRSLVVDNFIEKIVPTLSDEMKSRRSTMVTERNADMAAVEAAQAAAAAARAAAAANRGGRRGRGRRNAAGSRQTRRPRGSDNAPPNHDIPPVAEIAPPNLEPIEVSSNSSNDTSDSSMNSDSSSVSGDEDRYFGGYGRCYSCGRRGHWANGCPDRW